MVGVVLALVAGAPAQAASTVRAGEARFRVITPSLVRAEYAADGRFENRPTLNVVDRSHGPVAHTVERAGERTTIRTRRVVVRYVDDGEPLGPTNLSLRLLRGGPRAPARPEFGPAPGPPAGPPSLEVSPYTVTEDPDYAPPTSGNLGGWYRALDLAGGPVGLHDGLLSRDGWYLLDDTHTALVTDQPPGFAARPEREGAYRDGYLFAYGRDYARGLRDLRALTGAAPLLPRQAFGVWFSRYFDYAQSDYPGILERFRAARIPLDVLMVDTDFKSPHAWNGWNWDPALFPDPSGFFEWADDEGIAASLNVHPSITAEDPRFAEAMARAGGELPPDPTSTRCRTFVEIGDAYGKDMAGTTADCRVFDWTDPGNLNAYFWLHEPFEREGTDFWWLDYCCDESYAVAPGLTQDTWINRLYAERNRARGSRWPVLSRVGASVFEPDEAGAGIWGEHRSAIHFTGDARPTWEMLDFQSAFTSAEGNVGIPYVSHDIGGFGSITSDGLAGRHLPDELYVRWVQSGAFQPILRLHSDHGDRLPWDYPGRAEEIATEFLRLRGALVPYLYTLARRAHDRGRPITERAYLRWPRHEGAYTHDRQYLLGSLLVAPVGTPGDPATKEVWFPPGEWVDVFTGERHRGPATETLSVPLERMPVFARAGAVVPMQGYAPEGNAGPPERLVIAAYPGRRGGFTLYEDAGDGLGYERGRFARTRISQRREGAEVLVTIGAAKGDYPGMPKRRRYEIRVYDGEAEPAEVLRTGPLATDRPQRIGVRP